jgi:hypothetical protein
MELPKNEWGPLGQKICEARMYYVLSHPQRGDVCLMLATPRGPRTRTAPRRLRSRKRMGPKARH